MCVCYCCLNNSLLLFHRADLKNEVAKTVKGNQAGIEVKVVNEGGIMIVRTESVIGTMTEIAAMIGSVIERGSALAAMILGVTADHGQDP